MQVTYKPIEKNTGEFPRLMVSKYGQIVLVTKSNDKKEDGSASATYVTVLHDKKNPSSPDIGKTWESDVSGEDYNALPKGTSIELVN